MPIRVFDFYGFVVRLESDSVQLLDDLARDFAFFLTETTTKPESLLLQGYLQAPDFGSIPDLPVHSVSPRNLV